MKILFDLFMDNPRNPFLMTISSFVLGVNVHTPMYDNINFFLKETAFVVSIFAGILTIYSAIKKNFKNEDKRISKRR